MDFKRLLLAITTTALGAAAFAQLAEQPLPPPEPSQPPPLPAPVDLPQATLTPIAIIYTAEEGMTRPQIERWDDDGPTLVDLAGARVDYFTVTPATITLSVGGSFDLRALTVEAHGLNGGAVGGAPLKIELEAPDGMIDVALATTNGQLVARARGIARLWVESYLPRGTGTGEHFRLPVVVLVR